MLAGDRRRYRHRGPREERCLGDTAFELLDQLFRIELDADREAWRSAGVR